MCFPLPLDLRKLNGRNFQIRSTFRYVGRGMVWDIPAGTTTDFASIPWFVYWLIPGFGQYDKPAVVHDWMYRTACVSRVVADAIFLDGMAQCGVPEWKRKLIYRAVRRFGKKAYKGPWND